MACLCNAGTMLLETEIVQDDLPQAKLKMRKKFAKLAI